MTDRTEFDLQQALSPALFKKYQNLKDFFDQNQRSGICIAYSGGVDSTLLLKIAAGASAGRPVLAVILETQLHPHSDTQNAYSLAEQLNAHPEIIRIDEFQDPEILQNPVNRCYLCKRLLFASLKKLSLERGCHLICDGTNKDDEREYRPGMKVLQELGIRSPLLEFGITKAEVRAISQALGLPTASVPSTPCLATRLPYHTYLDRDLLDRINKGETWLREKGFYNVRLRYHEPILRLEIDCESFSELLAQRTAVTEYLKTLGFPYITLDLEGFRSGSMDINLQK